MTVDQREQPTYTAEDLQHLTDCEHVRRRPVMYLGSTAEVGLQRLACEALEFVVSEALRGHADRIDVIVNQDGSLFVQHNGRGIPVDRDTRLSKQFDRSVSVLEGVMTFLSYGAQYKVFRNEGFHSIIGVNIANYLAEWCVVESRLNGRAYRQQYRRGSPESPVEDLGPTTESGVAIAFLPDGKIFSTVHFEPGRLYSRVEELSFLLPETRFSFEDRRRHTFHSRKGACDLVERCNIAREKVHEPIIHVRGERDGVGFDVAFQYYRGGPDEPPRSFVNRLPVKWGGTHVEGFKQALLETLIDFYRLSGQLSAATLPHELIEPGLFATVIVDVRQPLLAGPNGERLVDPKVKDALYAAMTGFLRDYWKEHPQTAAAILNHMFGHEGSNR